jgi:hypothetical protein
MSGPGFTVFVMEQHETGDIVDVTIQVPLSTSPIEAKWLASMLPYLATVVFDGTDTRCVLTAPGHVSPKPAAAES